MCQLWIFFFFNDTATTEIYTLSLHDALPISPASAARGFPPHGPDRPGAREWRPGGAPGRSGRGGRGGGRTGAPRPPRSEEHTSELQSRQYLVCRLLLEKKKRRYTHLAQNTTR